MRRELMFDSSVRCVFYLVLLICSPIAPIIIQLCLKSSGMNLYTSMLVSNAVIAYEYIGLYGEEKICPRLWVERLVGILSISVMLVYAVFMLGFRVASEEPYKYGISEYVFCGMWIVPAINGIIELIMVLMKEYSTQTASASGMAAYITNSAKQV